ncbi:MAG: c-type cytochrome biogenesis protein CcmI [Burkholderiaceae bacterium]
MTALTAFVLASALLVVVTLLLLLRPWRRRPVDLTASTREINAGIYRDQLAELDRDLAAGTLAEADHAQARGELQRRLLDDAGVSETTATAPGGARVTTVVIALALPLLAAAMYTFLGQPAALDPAARQASAQPDVEKMVATLAARLEAKPDDPKGWAVLGRSYRVMGRMPDAQKAFERIGAELDRDPVLLAEYADVLAANNNGNLEGKPMEAVARALKLDPDNPMALALSATAAFNRKDIASAVAQWERLLKQLPPESEDAKWVQNQLDQIRTAVASSNAARADGTQLIAPPTSASTPPAAGTVAAAGGDTSIRGQLSLAPALAAQALPTDTVFVFARALQGPRMPLAVQRAKVSDLPLSFKLDDSLAVSPDFKISGFTEVRIEARISRSGSATPSPGDLIGTGPVVKPGATGLSVKIDQTRP